MAFYKVCLILCFIHFLQAEEAQNFQNTQYLRPPSSAVSGNTGTTGFTVGKQYNLDAKVLKDGTASGSLYAMVGGQVGPGPTYYSTPEGPRENVNNSPAYYYDAASGQYGPSQALSQASSTSIWSPSHVNYYVAGGVFCVVLVGYGLYAFFTTPNTLLKGLGVAPDEDDTSADDSVASKKDSTVASKKSRRRREIRRNEEGARLASIVLSAIESGECLEKSICLMGSQIGGTQRGKLAGTLLQKMVPASLQENHYFLTLQKALQGPSKCNQFNCKY